jgi:hypothetical protein
MHANSEMNIQFEMWLILIEQIADQAASVDCIAKSRVVENNNINRDWKLN